MKKKACATRTVRMILVTSVFSLRMNKFKKNIIVTEYSFDIDTGKSFGLNEWSCLPCEKFE